jgi:serine/threonine-protein kinase HipA
MQSRLTLHAAGGPRLYGPLAVRAVFDNLLPDDDRIRARIATRVGADETDAFSMLAALGRDCVGALQFLPEDMSPAPPGPPEGGPITAEAIAERIRALSVGPWACAAVLMRSGFPWRARRIKTALLGHKGTWVVPVGATPTTYILKPQIGMV